MTQLRILGVGGAHIDRRGRIAGTYKPAASNPGTMAEEPGGAVFNALRTITQRGVTADLVAAIGGDAAGRMVAEAIAAAGIGDHCGVFLDRATASYTALLDERGGLIAGLADMAIHEEVVPRLLRRKPVVEIAKSADALLFDANLLAGAVSGLLDLAGSTPCYAIAVSPAKVVRLNDELARIACLFMNRAEASALTGLPAGTSPASLAGALRQLGLKSAVVSDGSGPLIAYDGGGVLTLDPPAPQAIADVTGAGDALAGAMTAALMAGKPLAGAMREGTAAALCTIESRSVVPVLDNGRFAKTLANMAVPRQIAP